MRQPARCVASSVAKTLFFSPTRGELHMLREARRVVFLGADLFGEGSVVRRPTVTVLRRDLRIQIGLRYAGFVTLARFARNTPTQLHLIDLTEHTIKNPEFLPR